MNKILSLAILLIGILSLTGCGKPQPVGQVGCNNAGCSGALGLRWTWKSLYPGIDLSQSRINLSNSNIGLLTNSGTMSVTIKSSSGVITASSVFNWHSVNDKIYPSNPSAASSWLNNNLQNNDEILFDISGIDFTGNIGANTLVALFEDDSGTVGVSDSFYFNNADTNGF